MNLFALSFTIDVWATLLWLLKAIAFMALGAFIMLAVFMNSFTPFRAILFALVLLPSLALAAEPDLQGDFNSHKTVVVDGRIRVKETLVSPCYDGGRIDFSGGTQNCLHFDWEYRQPEGMLGHASALVWAGEPNKGPILEVRGAGLLVTGGEGSRDALALPGRLQWQLGLSLFDAGRPQLHLDLHAPCCMSTPSRLHIGLSQGFKGLQDRKSVV